MVPTQPPSNGYDMPMSASVKHPQSSNGMLPKVFLTGLSGEQKEKFTKPLYSKPTADWSLDPQPQASNLDWWKSQFCWPPESWGGLRVQKSVYLQLRTALWNGWDPQHLCFQLWGSRKTFPHNILCRSVSSTGLQFAYKLRGGHVNVQMFIQQV